MHDAGVQAFRRDLIREEHLILHCSGCAVQKQVFNRSYKNVIPGPIRERKQIDGKVILCHHEYVFLTFGVIIKEDL